MPIIDSQVHAYEANTPKRPWATQPNWPDHVTGDEMVAAMDKVGVDGAIFISAHSLYQYDASYAVEVQRAHPNRLAIVKPVNPERLSETLRRLKKFADLQRLQPTAASETSEPSPGEDDDDNPVASPARPGGSGERGLGDTIHVRLRHSRLLAAMTIDRICWIESLRNYTRVCLRNPGRVVVFRRRLGEWEVDLPAGLFARLGRSLLVRTDAIAEPEWKSRNETVLKFGAGIEPLVIGRLAAMRLRDILDGEGEAAP